MSPENKKQNGIDSTSPSDKLVVRKRKGKSEPVMYDKITSRIRKLMYNLQTEFIDPGAITYKVIRGIYPGVSTVELDNLAAEVCATLTTKHTDHAILAARIEISNLHKETVKDFSEVVELLRSYKDPNTNLPAPKVNERFYNAVMKEKERLNSAIIYDRDFSYDYFAIKTLKKSYLFKIDGEIVERPQHMLMRCAVGIHYEDVEAAIETYELLSQKYFTHASPTLFNAGSTHPQLFSCFLLTMTDDSIDGIFDTLKLCSKISKFSGGIGLNVHCIRAKGTPIASTNGVSDGLVPMLRVYNESARYVNQGGKRPGAYAIYLEPWHADIFEFVQLRRNIGSADSRTRDLFIALWVPDLFMERVENDGDWSLFCPRKCPDLHETYGEEFNKLYVKYEKEGRYNRQVKARFLWNTILDSQMETGTPYMCYKDHANRKSNQKNLGTIKCSNLCTEIMEYSSPDEVAVCNLASIALPKFVDQSTKKFDFKKLKDITKVVTRNLNKGIDISFYPVSEAKLSNERHRPIGIGVQGLADAFILLRYPFDSPEARQLNIKIFETIYYGALEASCELAEKLGPYETYDGSPASKGILQYDMWNRKPTDLWDWDLLKAKISKYGLRNSLLIAPMPTASTAQILGNNESIEPYTNNIYTRRVLSGEFQVVNNHLVKDLADCGLWNDEMRLKIISKLGSVQEIDEIPNDIKALYRTVWEISQKSLVEMAADRGAFIDQSQSLNIHFAKPTYEKLTSMHFFGWKSGLKTGMYYLRTKPAANAIQFTVDKSKIAVKSPSSKTNGHAKNNGIEHSNGIKMPTKEEIYACSINNKDECTMCGS